MCTFDFTNKNKPAPGNIVQQWTSSGAGGVIDFAFIPSLSFLGVGERGYQEAGWLVSLQATFPPSICVPLIRSSGSSMPFFTARVLFCCLHCCGLPPAPGLPYHFTYEGLSGDNANLSEGMATSLPNQLLPTLLLSPNLSYPVLEPLSEASSHLVLHTNSQNY